ncbi:MAG: saccharopine dehydrogenase NADP-binding domain-containing protein [Bacteroidetes bacterium]|nr:saccharopine dehydrogenase NADP-binding domain-containing protein [Bacteroidota bacterium]
MRNILVLGAGKSSIYLIDYLVKHAAAQQWQVTVADVSTELALHKTKNRPHTQARSFDFNDTTGRQALIKAADVVISMLPAAMHPTIAKDCLRLRKHLVTPSYISEAMQGLHTEAVKRGLVFMNEIGLDPGIDHMSSMQVIHRLKAEGKVITGYKSHCGGLIAPESDTNPWHYKFTWNPRNVILAGQGDGFIQYLEQGKKRKLKYEQLFSTTSALQVRGYGNFESYPNRDSLKYIGLYGLQDVKTMYRGTLRRPLFCAGWQWLVDLGFTGVQELDTAAFQKRVSRLLKSRAALVPSRIHQLLEATAVLPALYNHSAKSLVPAQLLQSVLEEQWALQPRDKDMVVMVHEFFYRKGRVNKKLQSSLVVLGENQEHTAMAKTVGLPLGMVTKLILNQAVKATGVLMPKDSEVYNPILAELETYGIGFKEKITKT